MRKQAKKPPVISGVSVIEQPRKNGSLDPTDLKKKIRKTGHGGKSGVYVYGLRDSTGRHPVWVGHARKQSFEAECCSDHVMSKVREALLQNRGTPVLYLLPQGRPGQGKTDMRAIMALEKRVIGMAHAANPRRILNKYGLPSKPNAQTDESLPVGRGRLSKAGASLRKMLKRRK
ncbi:MAG: hypothetical protein WCE40_06640 [Polyangia bacterium]